VKDLARRKTAANRARFETVRPSEPVASPAVEVPLDLNEGTETGEYRLTERSERLPATFTLTAVKD
jgi:hypothetical protein